MFLSFLFFCLFLFCFLCFLSVLFLFCVFYMNLRFLYGSYLSQLCLVFVVCCLFLCLVVFVLFCVCVLFRLYGVYIGGQVKRVLTHVFNSVFLFCHGFACPVVVGVFVPVFDRLVCFFCLSMHGVSFLLPPYTVKTFFEVLYTGTLGGLSSR